MHYVFLCRGDNGSIWRAGHTIRGLCSAWNHATDPKRPMDDKNHARSSLYSKAIKARMARLGFRYERDYLYLSDGRMWPIVARHT